MLQFTKASARRTENHPCCVTNKLDQAGVEILRYQYDRESRLTNRWSKEKSNTKYAYDPVGNLTNIDYNASTDVRFGFDALDRMTNMVDAAGTTLFTWTAGNSFSPKTAPLPATLSRTSACFDYDAALRLTVPAATIL